MTAARPPPKPSAHISTHKKKKKTSGKSFAPHSKAGSGARFKACVSKMAHKKGIRSPKGVCASIGRRKYGAKGMARMAAAGRRRK